MVAAPGAYRGKVPCFFLSRKAIRDCPDKCRIRPRIQHEDTKNKAFTKKRRLDLSIHPFDIMIGL
jgi:hypothetical protein